MCRRNIIWLFLLLSVVLSAQKVDQIGALIRQQRYSEALQLTTIQLRAHPRNGQLYTQRAWLYQRLSQPGLAILDIDQAIKHASSAELTRSQLYFMRGDIHSEVKMYIDAYEDYTIALERDPNCAQCYAHRGDLCLTLDYYPLAVENYAEALRIESYNTEYRVEYARALLANAQYGEAAQQLQQVLADDPGTLEAKRLLATYHYLQNEPEVYIDLYLAYLQEYFEANHEPSKADHLLYHITDSVSYAYLSSALTRYIDHTAGDIQVMFRYIRANIRCQHGDFSGAIADLSVLISDEQDYDHSALEKRAYNYMQSEQYSLAIKDYTQLISLEPRNTQAYYGRAIAYQNMQQVDEAITDFISLTRLSHQEAPLAFYQAARMEVQRENYIQAIRYLSRSIELMPDAADLYRYRAEQYEALGNSRMAELDYQAAELLTEPQP